MAKPIQAYTLNEFRKLRKTAVLIGIFVAIIGIAILGLIAYMRVQEVPAGKIYSFSSTATVSLLAIFWGVLIPKNRLLSKISQLHPAWGKEPYMNTKLEAKSRLQIIGVPLVLTLVILLTFRQFYQPQPGIDKLPTPIPAVEPSSQP